MQLQSLKLLCLTVKGKVHLQENTLFDLELVAKVTQYITQYPLHHVAYSHVKFEVATSNGLGEECTKVSLGTEYAYS